ncbi:NAD-dependent epimerase/dehydratase family protein [Hyphomonas sp. NPDC076900]|uniref:NAD-dependent epimerase/dehydratase family protein n=1 Tax=unclassified Hyphomonas TaxID=2630699 RepID=UPI003CFBECCD
MTDRPLIALTGATGFVGKILLADLSRRGHRVRALARAAPGRTLPAYAGVEWVAGDLASEEALSSLVRGARVVIHLAGATKARDAATFHEVNAARTGDLVRRAQAAGVEHFIHVSSLTAQRPDVSPYARSKADGEKLAAANAGSMALTIFRAPAVLGPDDDATRALFSALARGLLPCPGGAAENFRFSVIDVADASRCLADCATDAASGIRSMAPAGHLNLGWDDVAQSAQRVLLRPVRRVVMPPLLMKTAGHAADLAVKLNGQPQVFSSGKVQELLSGDWLAETQIPGAIPLDVTLQRCIAPFQRSAREMNRFGKKRA